mgnify:FL=1
MRGELRKITGSQRLCLLLVLAVLCSGVLFALHATGDSGGYTVSGLRHAMAQEDLDGYEERLWQELEQVAYTGARSEYDALRRELYAADAALARVRQAEEYPSFRAGLAAESRLKLRMGLFDGFAARSLEQGAQVYESLADVTPRREFLGSAEVLLSFHLTDALALLFPLAAGLTLLTHERASGLLNLTRPTRFGRSRVYGRKLAAAATLSTVGFVLLYGINALIAGLLYGFAGLDAPVQSLYGFAACPYRMTVGGLLALSAGMKYLWLLCSTALIFLLCARASNAAAVGCAAVCGGIAALMAGSSQLWLRNLSLWQLADGQALCREAVYLNLLGSPSDRVLLGAIFLAALAVIAGIGGAALYAQTPGGSGKRVTFTWSLPRPRHTCLAGHELYKALISRCGLWILLAFFAVIALLYGRFTPERSEFEVYYRNYSEFLSGAPSQEKDDYLASEQARFDELNEQLVELWRRYPDSVIFDREAEPIRNQLHAEDAFHLAQNQYRALRPGQVYLYQTGYQRLLGADALRQDVLELGGAFLAVALLLFGSFAGERESGVDALLTASPRRRSVVRWKCVIAGGYVLLLTLALWLPGLLTVQGAYGSLDMAAQANSVQCLSVLSDGWTVGGVVLALLAIRLLLLAVAAAAVMLLSRRCATVPTLLLSVLLLLLPAGTAYVWM